MAGRGRFLRRFGVRGWTALAVAALVVAMVAPPALAQFGGPYGRRPSSNPFDFWGPYQGPRVIQTEPRADYSRAPAPRKAETPPSSLVLVLGDSMADWLAYGLEDALSDTPELGVVRKHRTSSGLIRYDTRNENVDWAQTAREAIAATKPKFVVMMVGLNDRQAIRVRQQAPGPTAPAGAAAPSPAAPSTAAKPADSPDPAETPAPEPSVVTPEPHSQRSVYHVYDFRSDPWVEQYTKRIDATIAALKSANVPVLWVGLPSIRGPKSTADMQFLDDLFHERAEKAGITYIDVWEGFVDDSGRFAAQGPDFEGQTRRLRPSDGVHFTKAGARKLAHYVERELRRVMTRDVTAVALPTTEPAPQAPASRPGQPAARPLSGPVLPLTVAVTAQQDLAGGGALGPLQGQPVVVRVLQKGEAVPAPAGRSDDFAWPRRSIGPFGSDPLVATTTDPIPVMQAAPAATTVPVPNEETRPVAVAAPRRTARAPSQPSSQQQQGWGWGWQQQQQQQRRNNNSFFGFWR